LINFFVNVLTFDHGHTSSIEKIYTADPSRVWGGGEAYLALLRQDLKTLSGLTRGV
jgi:hypothetical protein